MSIHSYYLFWYLYTIFKIWNRSIPGFCLYSCLVLGETSGDPCEEDPHLAVLWCRAGWHVTCFIISASNPKCPLTWRPFDGWRLTIYVWGWDIECHRVQLVICSAQELVTLTRWNGLTHFSSELRGSASILRHQISSVFCSWQRSFLPSSCPSPAGGDDILKFASVLLQREHQGHFWEDQIHLPQTSLVKLERNSPNSEKCATQIVILHPRLTDIHCDSKRPMLKMGVGK